MKVTIQNIGKIRNAEIEINGITVIAGENNTGKSTIGKVLYSFFNTFFDIENKAIEEKKSYAERLVTSMLFVDDDTITIDIGKIWSIENQLNKMFSEGNIITEEILDRIAIELPDLYDENMKKNIENLAEKLRTVQKMDSDVYAGQVLQNNLNREFNKQIKNVNSSGECFIKFVIANQEYNINFQKDRLVFDKIFKNNNEVVYIDNPYALDNVVRIPRRTRVIYHQDKLREQFLSDGKSDSNIYSEILQNCNIEETMEQISKAVKGRFVDLTGRIAFLENGMKDPIYISNLSTGLKTFVIIKKLLENGTIREKSVLILDEPEIHLHPKWQLVLAEAMIILQKEFNLHILINTHSPYFLNAIEVYSAKHKITDRNKYYLSALEEDGITAKFEDVTFNRDRIYALLAMPMKELDEMSYDLER